MLAKFVSSAVTFITIFNGSLLVPDISVGLVKLIVGKIVSAYAGSRLFGLSPKVSCRAGFSMVQRGEFSAIIASLAIPQLRIFSGIYIVITAFIGVYLFGRAPAVAVWYNDRIKARANREGASVKKKT